MKETAVNIEVQYKERTFDLRVPNRVSLWRLQTLLAPVLAQQGTLLPAHWQLQVADKPVRLAEQTRLDHYPIANGDRFVITTQEEGTQND